MTMHPPFLAQPSGGANAWWYVADSTGFNCLEFKDHPGAKFTSESEAKEIAGAMNKVDA